jgi:hypothetical protein
VSAARYKRRGVPTAILVLLGASLALQIAWRASERAGAPAAEDLPPAPRPAALKLAALGEPQALARLTMLYLQAFDYRSGNRLPYQKLDYDRLIAWLDAIVELDPRSQYALFSAARIYAEVDDPVRERKMLEFIYRRFLEDPGRRWPWLAHAALLAKHRLKDLALARRFASAIDRLVTGPDVPSWAKQMEIFILEDMNELEAARALIGGLLASGRITNPEELRFLDERLKILEARIRAQGGSKPSK